jgi:hypothetical protein
VRAYKFLKQDGTAPFTGFHWPAGEWVEVNGPLSWCMNGIHACRIADLPHWIGQELWLMELAGEILAADDSLVAQRARLVEHIEAWSDGVAQEFGDSCARRAISLAAEAPSTAERARDAVTAAANGLVAGSAYIAAAVAGEVAWGARTGPRYERGFLSERSRQAGWIKDRLTLAQG